MDIPRRRLASHRLTGQPYASFQDAVRAYGAVQAQDYPAARWAVGQRVAGATAAAFDEVFDSGAVLRTHVLRPTWHFVLPEDIRWLLALTGPRLQRASAGRYRRLELTDRDLKRGLELFASALAGGRALTRPELGDVLAAGGISPAGQRLPHLLGHAEYDALIVSGPRRGREMTYALLDERIPGRAGAGRDPQEALADLAARYFATHGPATLRDFAWWSGLPLADCRRAVAAFGVELSGSDREAPAGRSAHLLPNFDEYTVAYRDRSDLFEPGIDFRPELFSFQSVLSNVLLLDGRVVGAWKRAGRRMPVGLLRPLSAKERELTAAAAERMGAFLGGGAPVLDLP
ncbi:MAG TPA: winged helix DNA-binding domain-containing protein [Candidatus Dormibacteraeota bacterium]